MTIFILDDEPLLLFGESRTIQEVAPEAEVLSFSDAAEALAAIREQGIRPDVVFTDIEMPGMSGLELAAELKTLCPDTRVVFVTGYSEYAVEAFRLHVSGYILKPLDPERIQEELGPHAAAPETGGDLFIRCFGFFEVFWKGEPLMFARRQTKELLALLIHREGAACTAEEASAILWPEEPDLKKAKPRLRNLVHDLRNTLADLGMGDLLIRRSGEIAIRRDAVDCDYYRMLNGDMDAVNAFRGEYMVQYPWAELNAGKLRFYSETGPDD